MPKCFVIQPFDRDKFDKRYQDVFKPAIEAAGFIPYRVDEDFSVLIPIDRIETGIREAAACLADITSDNPNVWFELGFAIACRKKIVIVCERQARIKHPFDIQHRAITEYATQSSSDFQILGENITKRLQAIVASPKAEAPDLPAPKPPISLESLSEAEKTVLFTIIRHRRIAQKTVEEPQVYEFTMASTPLNKLSIEIAINDLEEKKLITSRTARTQTRGRVRRLSPANLGWKLVKDNQAFFDGEKL